MKKVLVITYYWPPSGGSGVQRWMYFCKYLPEFGYDPIVLTVSEKKASYKDRDTSFIDRVKDVKTYKTDTLEPLKLYSLMTTGSSSRGIPYGHVGTRKNKFFRKLSSYIRGNFFIPDARIGWKSYALKEARKILASQKIELMITTGPPHSTHLIGLQLKKEFSVKWMADLRDPWTDVYFNKHLYRTKRAIRKDQLLEKEVLENADKVLTVSFKLKEWFQHKVKSNEDKFHYIYNGYDSVLMKQIPVETQDHFEVTSIGLLTQSQPYTSIIEILKEVLNKIPDANIKICLAGNIQKDVLHEMEKEFTPSKIIYKGYVPHTEALSLMKRSQLLINVLPEEMKENQMLISSGKQMEYVATGNPILCIGSGEGTTTALLLKDIPNAKIFGKQQIEESVEFVLDLYKKWEEGVPCTNDTESDSIKNKSRFETTRQLSQLIDQM